MNGENDHLFDDEHLDLCPECGKNPCDCKPESKDRDEADREYELGTAERESAALRRKSISDGDLADAIVATAQRVAGLTDRTKITPRSLLLEKIYGQLSDLCERLDQ
jgi:hypothetical protein